MTDLQKFEKARSLWLSLRLRDGIRMRFVADRALRICYRYMAKAYPK